MCMSTHHTHQTHPWTDLPVQMEARRGASGVNGSRLETEGNLLCQAVDQQCLCRTRACTHNTHTHNTHTHTHIHTRTHPHTHTHTHMHTLHTHTHTQVINNACATQAIISVLLNITHPDVELGSVLADFKDFSRAFDPAVSGEAESGTHVCKSNQILLSAESLNLIRRSLKISKCNGQLLCFV